MHRIYSEINSQPRERTPMTDKTRHPAKDKSAPGRSKAAGDIVPTTGASDHNRTPMKDKTGDAAKDNSAPKPKMTAEDIARATGTSDPNLILHLLHQAMRARMLFEQATKTNRSLNALLAALKGIAPQNEMEGMLAVQMVSTHNAAMECLGRAMICRSFEGRDQNLKYAAKLMNIYIQQLEALDKRRGKGQQKITVEHVNVHAGGQAIVGNVEAPARSAAAPSPPIAPAALPDRSGEALPLIEERAKEKVPSKLRSR